MVFYGFAATAVKLPPGNDDPPGQRSLDLAGLDPDRLSLSCSVRTISLPALDPGMPFRFLPRESSGYNRHVDVAMILTREQKLPIELTTQSASAIQ